MPVSVHTQVHGHEGTVKAIKTLQTALGVTASVGDIDKQQHAAKIIALQKAFHTANPASVKAPTCLAIDDQMLGAKLMELEAAINSP